MERRSFLKALTALAAAPLIKVPDFRVIEPSGMILPGEKWFSTIRQLEGYDIESDRIFFRWDAFYIRNGLPEQSHVTFVVRDPTNVEDMNFVRRDAIAALRSHLEHKNINVRDLLPLPIENLAGHSAKILKIGPNGLYS